MLLTRSSPTCPGLESLLYLPSFPISYHFPSSWSLSSPHSPSSCHSRIFALVRPPTNCSWTSSLCSWIFFFRSQLKCCFLGIFSRLSMLSGLSFSFIVYYIAHLPLCLEVIVVCNILLVDVFAFSFIDGLSTRMFFFFVLSVNETTKRF